ncbi:hypothetical protein B0T16DRAFT_63218 [Cercophora newfieldiana]|uniref:Uncharacterized protein n=1 Tax=Cercophora newfieldiana TaxID=92897 RepID=A0AA39YTW6_9PEZI|nr:hypothetical protein B0T16DRAFT_63218 [Cercophora newfieldiana]
MVSHRFAISKGQRQFNYTVRLSTLGLHCSSSAISLPKSSLRPHCDRQIRGEWRSTAAAQPPSNPFSTSIHPSCLVGLAAGLDGVFCDWCFVSPHHSASADLSVYLSSFYPTRPVRPSHHLAPLPFQVPRPACWHLPGRPIPWPTAAGWGVCTAVAGHGSIQPCQPASNSIHTRTYFFTPRNGPHSRCDAQNFLSFTIFYSGNFVHTIASLRHQVAACSSRLPCRFTQALLLFAVAFSSSMLSF